MTTSRSRTCAPSTADATAASSRRSGRLTPPRRRGGSGRFLTDVLVELGLHRPASGCSRRSRRRRLAGVPPERLLLDQRAITAEQLSHAIAERYGLDHLDLGVFKVDMAAANLLSVSAAKRYGAVPGLATSTSARCWWRWPTRRTCWRSTTSRC